MKRVKRILYVLVCCMAAFFMTACGDFDAAGYTEAVLDMTFQGETEELAGFDKEKSSKELEEEYEEAVAAFSLSLTEGLDAGSSKEEEFYDLCRKIFSTARYNVTESGKKSKEEYKVTVEIEPSDVFVRWKELLEESVADIEAKAEAGEYSGTESEILEQMLGDIAAQSCELLDTAYGEMSYGEKETVVLTVKKGENGKFALDDEEISGLVAKILRLDTIQG